MENFLRTLLSILQQGLIYGIVAMGVYITYKLLDFPDLSVDGTFPLGGAVTAILVINGLNGWLSLLVALLAGGAAGFLTGILHVKLKITNLLSGIIVMTALITVNLWIAGGAILAIPNVQDTIFSGFGLRGTTRSLVILLLIFLIALIIKVLFDLYMKTKSGFLLRAVGDNEQLVTSLGKDVGKVKIVGLVLANALVAVGGSLYTQWNFGYDASSGTGMVVIGIVCVIIGLVVFGKIKFMRPTTAVILGGIIYAAFLTIAISIGIDGTAMKLVNAVLFVIILCLNKDLISFKRRQKRPKDGGGKSGEEDGHAET